MSVPEIDYRAVFRETPGMVSLLTPDLVYADVNDDYERFTGCAREELIGRYLFDVFPDNPADPDATGVSNMHVSMRRVFDTGKRDTMAPQRYDVRSPHRSGRWEPRYWSPVNGPIFDADGNVVLLANRVAEITELIHDGERTPGNRVQKLEAEMYTRAQELQEVNEELREERAREQRVALALQEAMLPGHVTEHYRVAVRYQPAVNTLNVCGDWYDFVDLPRGRLAVSVGDVVGHGLHAAGVMGQLRSALSAVSQMAPGPAEALTVLGLYASTVEGAESTTAVSVHIDRDARLLTYSSAGHLPPAVVRADGSVAFLDQATDPPLAVRAGHEIRPQAELDCAEQDTLVLYTDGLIERRGEDIDAGLGRLADSLAGHRDLDPEQLADALLADLLPAAGAADDAALVVVRI